MIGSLFDHYLLWLLYPEEYDPRADYFKDLGGLFLSNGGIYLQPFILINRREMPHVNKRQKCRNPAERGRIVFIYDAEGRGHSLSTKLVPNKEGINEWRVIYRNRNAVSSSYPFGQSFQLNSEFEIPNEMINTAMCGPVLHEIVNNKNFKIDDLINKYIFSPNTIDRCIIQQGEDPEQHMEIFLTINNGQLEKFKSKKAVYESRTNQHRNIISPRRNHMPINHLTSSMVNSAVSNNIIFKKNSLNGDTSEKEEKEEREEGDDDDDEEEEDEGDLGETTEDEDEEYEEEDEPKRKRRKMNNTKVAPSPPVKKKAKANPTTSTAAAEHKGQTIRTLSFNLVTNAKIDSCVVRPLLGSVPRGKIPINIEFFLDSGDKNVKVDKHFRWLTLLPNVILSDRLLFQNMLLLPDILRVMLSLDLTQVSDPSDPIQSGIVVINGAIPTIYRLKNPAHLSRASIIRLKQLNRFLEVWFVPNKFVMLNLIDGIPFVPVRVNELQVYVSPLELATKFHKFRQQLYSTNLYGPSCDPHMRENINDMAISKLQAITSSSNQLSDVKFLRYFCLTTDVFGSYPASITVPEERKEERKGEGEGGRVECFDHNKHTVRLRQTFANLHFTQNECYAISDAAETSVWEIYHSKIEVEYNRNQTNVYVYKSCDTKFYDYNLYGTNHAVNVPLFAMEYDSRDRKNIKINQQIMSRTRIYCFKYNLGNHMVRMILVKRIEIEPHCSIKEMSITAIEAATKIKKCILFSDLTILTHYPSRFTGLKLGDQCGQKGIVVWQKLTFDELPSFQQPALVGSIFSIFSRQSHPQLKQMVVNQRNEEYQGGLVSSNILNSFYDYRILRNNASKLIHFKSKTDTGSTYVLCAQNIPHVVYEMVKQFNNKEDRLTVGPLLDAALITQSTHNTHTQIVDGRGGYYNSCKVGNQMLAQQFLHQKYADCTTR